MAEKTGIEWADSTANLWMGCTKVSRACDHCYAERDFADHKKMVVWGPHGPRRYVQAGWKLLAWAQKRTVGGIDPDLGRKRRVFVNSLSDFFDNHKSIEQAWRDDAFKLFEACPDVIIMLVTKRPQNVRKFAPAHWMVPGGWPAHVWLMVTAEDQEQAEIRVPVLLSLPAPVKCISAEPLVGPIDLTQLKVGHSGMLNALTGKWASWPIVEQDGQAMLLTMKDVEPIRWVIGGGESGPEAEPTHQSWARSLRDQCAAAGVAFLFKQWGEWFPYGGIDADGNQNSRTMGEKHDVWREWPDGGGFSVRIGKVQAGRYLDGVLHTDFPVAA